jgi:hypothetical protein
MHYLELAILYERRHRVEGSSFANRRLPAKRTPILSRAKTVQGRLLRRNKEESCVRKRSSASWPRARRQHSDRARQAWAEMRTKRPRTAVKMDEGGGCVMHAIAPVARVILLPTGGGGCARNPMQVIAPPARFGRSPLDPRSDFPALGSESRGRRGSHAKQVASPVQLPALGARRCLSKSSIVHSVWLSSDEREAFARGHTSRSMWLTPATPAPTSEAY